MKLLTALIMTLAPIVNANAAGEATIYQCFNDCNVPSVSVIKDQDGNIFVQETEQDGSVSKVKVTQRGKLLRNPVYLDPNGDVVLVTDSRGSPNFAPAEVSLQTRGVTYDCGPKWTSEQYVDLVRRNIGDPNWTPDPKNCVY